MRIIYKILFIFIAQLSVYHPCYDWCYGEKSIAPGGNDAPGQELGQESPLQPYQPAQFQTGQTGLQTGQQLPLAVPSNSPAGSPPAQSIVPVFLVEQEDGTSLPVNTSAITELRGFAPGMNGVIGSSIARSLQSAVANSSVQPGGNQAPTLNFAQQINVQNTHYHLHLPGLGGSSRTSITGSDQKPIGPNQLLIGPENEMYTVFKKIYVDKDEYFFKTYNEHLVKAMYRQAGDCTLRDMKYHSTYDKEYCILKTPDGVPVLFKTEGEEAYYRKDRITFYKCVGPGGGAVPAASLQDAKNAADNLRKIAQLQYLEEAITQTMAKGGFATLVMNGERTRWKQADDNRETQELIETDDKYNRVYFVKIFPEESYSVYRIYYDKINQRYLVTPANDIIDPYGSMASFLKTIDGFRMQIAPNSTAVSGNILQDRPIKDLPAFLGDDKKAMFSAHSTTTLEQIDCDKDIILLIDRQRVVCRKPQGKNYASFWRYNSSGTELVQCLSLESAKEGEVRLRQHFKLKLLTEMPQGETRVFAKKNGAKWEILEYNDATKEIIKQNTGTVCYIKILPDHAISYEMYFDPVSEQYLVHEGNPEEIIRNIHFAELMHMIGEFKLPVADHKDLRVFNGVVRDSMFSGNGNTTLELAQKGQYNVLVIEGDRVLSFQSENNPDYVTLWKYVSGSDNPVICSSLEEAKAAQSELRAHFKFTLLDDIKNGNVTKDRNVTGHQEYFAIAYQGIYKLVPQEEAARLIKENSVPVYYLKDELIQTQGHYLFVPSHKSYFYKIYYDSLADKALVSLIHDGVDADFIETKLKAQKELRPNQELITNRNKDCKACNTSFDGRKFDLNRIFDPASYKRVEELRDTWDSDGMVDVVIINGHRALFKNTKATQLRYGVMTFYKVDDSGSVVKAQNFEDAIRADDALRKKMGFEVLETFKQEKKSRGVEVFFINEENEIIEEEDAQRIIRDLSRTAYLVDLRDKYKTRLIWDAMLQNWVVFTGLNTERLNQSECTELNRKLEAFQRTRGSA